MTTRHVLVVNAGSSSLKYQVLALPEERVVIRGQIDRIGVAGGAVATHREAVAQVLAGLPADVDIDAVGHRVVHGGSAFTEPTLVADSVLGALDDVSELAPLHNPPNLQGIRAAKDVLSSVPHVAVFDTAFFHTLTPAAYRYALPRDLADQYHLRKYGFHGTSHDYVSGELERLLPPSAHLRRVITLHLGNGSSMAALRGGVAIDTSMGFTPLAGLVMGTRSGDVDPAVVPFLQERLGLTTAEVSDLLNKDSGLLGLTGSSDMRDVFARHEAGDALASEAIDIWAWRIRHYLGAYMAQLGGVDAVIFTGGIGENQGSLRQKILEGLDGFGMMIDPVANEAKSGDARRISPESGPVEVWVIPTNEELHIARHTARLLQW